MGIALGLVILIAPFAWLAWGRIPDVQADADCGHGSAVGRHGAPLKYKPTEPNAPTEPPPRHPYRS